MLEAIIAVLIVLWLIGALAHIGGAAIHALLVIALIVVIVRVLQGRSV